ncbi:MAG: 3-hydroxyacyl-CoA dehydrogenase family protein [Chitinophagales bacterium]
MIHILLLGKTKEIAELQAKLANIADIKIAVNEQISSNYQFIIDADFEDNSQRLEEYALLENAVVMLSTVRKQLAETVAKGNIKGLKCCLVGFNALPTFINRPLWEISLFRPSDLPVLDQLLGKLSLPYKVVADRVGMVTPRIVCMIINEAFYALQENIASREAIDKAMKLGTRHPYGPFEWTEKIGVENVYLCLAAIYEDTKDECFKICPALKTAYWQTKNVALQ